MMTFGQQLALTVSVLGVWSALLLWCLKWMFDRHDQMQGRRLDEIGARLDGFRSEVHKLELELERAKRDAAERYLTRDDFAVFATGIEAKLDRLGRKFDAIGR